MKKVVFLIIMVAWLIVLNGSFVMGEGVKTLPAIETERGIRIANQAAKIEKMKLMNESEKDCGLMRYYDENGDGKADWGISYKKVENTWEPDGWVKMYN